MGSSFPLPARNVCCCVPVPVSAGTWGHGGEGFRGHAGPGAMGWGVQGTCRTWAMGGGCSGDMQLSKGFYVGAENLQCRSHLAL